MDARRPDFQSRALAATRFLPTAQSISIRLGPGEQEPVVWCVAFRGDAEELSKWREQLESTPWCRSEEVGPSLRRLVFEEGPLPMIWGVNQLLVSEIGNSLVFYASEESSRLLSPSSGSTGQVVMESASGGTAERPQVYASVSAELLRLLVSGEKATLDPQAPNAAKIASLLDVLAGSTSAVTFDLTILGDGIRARVQAEHPMAAALGPVLIASAFLRGGI